ncbi:(2Fe-2S)-binding protein [Geomonas silvestris]|uniref:(2Fe-2S)-binding protein n=1 Tax=Geomonas silvestris TaxID=2740184 RepID=A0A6V8MIQ6_9BACT|nr:(2Fe-2S)-binding protein [Geomonas silvestris]GFO59895.1 (2Fe-2S)-binding protein [Geomonas silvestris]
MTSLKVNGETYQVAATPDMPLLWVLRDHLKLTGTKFGCGEGLCGACTVLIDGAAERSCSITLAEVGERQVTTIEGIPANHPVKQAWLAEEVSQCGYCQPGQVVAAVALLKQNRLPSDEQINQAMSGNLCRCGTYQRIRKAIHAASSKMAKGGIIHE